MSTTDDINAAIAENAAGPKKVESDEATIEMHPIGDQIEAAKHVAGVEAVKKPHRGIRFTQFVKPGGGS